MKKINFLPIILWSYIFIFSSNHCNSQSALQWQKCLGGTNEDNARYIQQTSDGGFVVAGCSFSNDGDVSGNHGSYDYWVVKLDSTGDVQWQKCLGGTDYDWAYSIQQTSDGGFIVAGWSESNDGNVSGNQGDRDFWIVRLNSTGDVQWQKCLGGTSYDYAYSIQQTSDGGYIVAGYSFSNDGDVSGNHSTSTPDSWVVRLNSTGDVQWQKCLGGAGSDNAYSIQQTSDGGFIVAGLSASNDGDVSENHGNSDSWVVKLNSTGDVQWQKCLGGTSSDYAYSIQKTSDSGFIIAGYSNSNDGDVSGNHGSYDFWVVKLSSEVYIEELTAEDDVNIYPNPANDRINLLTKENATFEIINIQGQIVDTKSLIDKSNNLDISNLPSGVYTLRIKTDRGIAIRKLIKQ
ncbi:MAG: T9SS type A sorting domain-containing protein [Bacteroidota bacterium]